MTSDQINLLIQGVIAVAACLALLQISLAKKSFLINSRRESIKYSSELVADYLNNLIPRIDEIDVLLKENKFLPYPKEISLKLFSKKEILELDPALQLHIEYCFRFFIEEHKDIFKKVVSVGNAIESFSMPFVEKVADEQVAFRAIGRTHCGSINIFYFLYCFVRHDGQEGYYTNTVILYKLWSERIKRINLIKDIEEKAKTFFDMPSDKGIKPLGTS